VTAGYFTASQTHGGVVMILLFRLPYTSQELSLVFVAYASVLTPELFYLQRER